MVQFLYALVDLSPALVMLFFNDATYRIVFCRAPPFGLHNLLRFSLSFKVGHPDVEKQLSKSRRLVLIPEIISHIFGLRCCCMWSKLLFLAPNNHSNLWFLLWDRTRVILATRPTGSGHTIIYASRDWLRNVSLIE